MGTSVLHIKTEVECRVYLFDEEKGIAKPGTYFNLEVRKGEQDLLFVSTEDEAVICFKSYNFEEDTCNYMMTLDQSQFIYVDSFPTKKEISIGVEDDFGVVYSQDGLQLLIFQNGCLDEYHIQDGCKVIRDEAFYCCKKLTTITLPDSLTHIGNRAFSSCNLTTITLPPSLTYVGDCAFSGTGIRNVVSLSPNFTFRDGCLIDQINHRLLAYLSDKDKVSLPVGLTHIGNEAFYGCDYLIAITLPNSLTHIGKSAFSRCSNLTTVSLPNSITHIEGSAFWKCQNLTAITLPAGLIHIGDRAFEGCEKLTAITLPDGLTHIGNRAFMWCSNLTTITLPNSLTHIGDSAFSLCENLDSITLPDGLTHIGDNAFWECGNLTTITLPDGLTHIGDCAFCGCRNLTTIILPDGLVHIGDGAFLRTGIRNVISHSPYFIFSDGCLIDKRSHKLIALLSDQEQVVLPDGLICIGDRALDRCGKLTAITLPDGLIQIGKCALGGCGKLTAITLPDGSTHNGDWAFDGCRKLTAITLPDDLEELPY